MCILPKKETIAMRWRSLGKTILRSRHRSRTMAQISSRYLLIMLSWPLSTHSHNWHPPAQIQLPPPSNLQFILEPKSNPQNPTSYTITTPEKSKIHTAILNEIANRPKSTNLTYLLVHQSPPPGPFPPSFGPHHQAANMNSRKCSSHTPP